jgi:hypothetical protein
MRPEDLRALMAEVAAGSVTPDDAVARLASLPFAEVAGEAGAAAGGSAAAGASAGVLPRQDAGTGRPHRRGDP